MLRKFRSILFTVSFLLVISASSLGQTSSDATEVRPKVSLTFDLRPQTRLQVFGGGQSGDYVQWKLGAILSYRMKRLVLRRPKEIDEENEHALVIGAGYEYVQINESKTKRENRIIFQGTGRKSPGGAFLITDRNRLEFRFINGVYNFRYRNKLVADHAFLVNKFHFTPYASGELFWDRNHHSWNQNQYGGGVQLPYHPRLMLDVFFLHQNCTTCSQQHINVVGLTLNLYFKKK